MYCRGRYLRSICNILYSIRLGIHRLKKYIEEPKIQTTIALIIVTFGVSCYWHLDMVWNIITPVMLITIGAVAGTLSIFMISRMIENYMKVGTKILSAVGRETYVVVALANYNYAVQ